MKRTIPTIAGICAGITMLAAPALAGPDQAMKKNADKQAEKAQPTLEDYVGEFKQPELFIGSKAPKLQIAKFVKGDSVQEFEPGQVYVVEFWATWCGPGRTAFPHLSEMQQHFGDKVKFIGVNVWERTKDQAQRIDMVEQFVKDQGDRMSYTVAVEDGSAMAENWLLPADQNGIPAAFIVNGDGKIAWIGHPMNMEDALDEVVAGDFNEQDAKAQFKKDAMLMAALNLFSQDLQSNKLDEATTIANLLMGGYINDDDSLLNAIAWMMASNDRSGEEQYALAYKAARTACELTEWKDWSILDTYALACSKVGKTDEAIKWETKAIELVPAEEADAKAELQARLDSFKSDG